MARVRRLNHFNKVSIEGLKRFLGGYDRVDDGAFALVETYKGELSYLYVVGENGAGKTSYATIIKQIANGSIPVPEYLATEIDFTRFSFINYYIPPELFSYCNNIYDIVKLINAHLEADEKGPVKMASRYIRKISAGTPSISPVAVNVEFGATSSETKMDVELLINLLKGKLNKEVYSGNKSGILIILDNIDNIINNLPFAKFIKQLNEILVYNEISNVMFLLTSSIVGYEKLLAQESSFSTLFKKCTLDKFKDEELRQFISSNFTQSSIEINIDIINNIILITDSNIREIHEICYNLVESVQGNEIDMEEYTKILGLLVNQKSKGLIEYVHIIINKSILLLLLNANESMNFSQIHEAVNENDVIIIDAIRSLQEKGIITEDEQKYKIRNKLMLNCLINLKQNGHL